MKGNGEQMRLNGLLVDATVGNFFDSVEFQVLDMELPQGRKKPTHKVKVYDGIPGLPELRVLIAEKKKQFGQGFVANQDPDCQQAAANIALPTLMTQASFDIYDIGGKGKYINLVGQLI